MVAGLLLIGLAGLAVFTFLFFVNLPSVSSQLPPGSATLTVDLFLPVYGASPPVDTYASVRAEALGANPIKTIQFWVDGMPVDARSPADGVSTNTLDANWAWLPASAGVHVLVARVEDQLGNAAVSNPVRVIVSAAQPGDQPAGGTPKPFPGFPVSQRAGGAVSQGLPPLVAVPSTGQFSPAPSGPPNAVLIWVGLHVPVLAGVSGAPAAAQLATAVNGCDVNLYIYDKSQNEDGFFVYRMTAGDTSFKRIATLGASNGPVALLYVDAGQIVGTAQYYVSSFNTAGESDGNISQAAVSDAKCAAPVAAGPWFSKPKMTVSQPMDQVYCYLSFDNGQWVRNPAGMDSFVLPDAEGAFDLSAALGQLSPAPLAKDTSLRFECWGWSGGALQDLGKAQTVLKPGQSGFLTVNGERFQLVVDLGDASVNSPVPDGGGGGLPSPSIPVPFNVQWTTDGSVCVNHSANPVFFALICSGAVQASKAMIVWNWTGFVCFPGSGATCQPVTQVDGYRVYDAWTGVLVDTSHDQKQTLSILAPPAQPAMQQCFYVVAYKGDLVSPHSGTVCLPTPDKMKRVTLKPIEIATSKWEDVGNPSGSSDCGSASASDFYPSTTKLSGGYVIQADPNGCDDYYFALLLGRAAFDLGATGISAAKLQSAVLHILATPQPGWGLQNANCAPELDTVYSITGATDGHENMSRDYYDSVQWDEAKQDVVVTSAIKSWLQAAQPGKLNRPSFVLVPPILEHSGPEKRCISDYQLTLDLTSYP